MKIVTGATGELHVTSMDDGCFNAGVIGANSYVLDTGKKLEAKIVTNNRVSIGDGDLVIQGRHARIEAGTVEEVTIDTGAIGKKRNDLIVARYVLNSDDGYESVSLVVIKGAESSTPADPSYNKGTIRDGARTVDFPLYRVKIDGVSIEKIEKIHFVAPSLSNLMTSDGFVFKLTKLDDGRVGYIDENGRPKAFNDATELYNALQYSGLVTAEMTYEDMIDVLAEYFAKPTEFDAFNPRRTFSKAPDSQNGTSDYDANGYLNIVVAGGVTYTAIMQGTVNVGSNPNVNLFIEHTANSSMLTDVLVAEYESSGLYEFETVISTSGSTNGIRSADLSNYINKKIVLALRVKNRASSGSSSVSVRKLYFGGIAYENLFKATAETETKNGVTLTRNADGTFVLDGTSTALTSFEIGKFIADGTYKIVGRPKLSYSNSVFLDVFDGVSSITDNNGNGLTYSGSAELSLSIRVTSGVQCNGIVFKPMVSANINVAYDDYVLNTSAKGTVELLEPIRKAGNISDEINLREKKLTRKCSSVNADELSWSMSTVGGHNVFKATINGAKAVTSSTELPSVSINGYTTVPVGSTAETMTVSLSDVGNDEIVVIDDRYNSVDTFKSDSKTIVYANATSEAVELSTDPISLEIIGSGRYYDTLKGNTYQAGANGKNLLVPTLTSRTVSGVEITKNSDGTYKFVGTSTEAITVSIVGVTSIANGTYKFVGVPENSGIDRMQIQSSTNSVYGIDRGSGATINVTNSDYKVYLYINSGATVNAIVKPMLSADTSVTYADYEPHISPSQPQPIRSVGDSGCLDLGSLTWQKYTSGSNWIFYASVPNGRTNVGSGNKVSLIVDNGYLTSAIAMGGSASASSTDKTISWDATNSQVLIKDTSYTEATDFKTAMKGVKLLYEVADGQTAPQYGMAIKESNKNLYSGDISTWKSGASGYLIYKLKTNGVCTMSLQNMDIASSKLYFYAGALNDSGDFVTADDRFVFASGGALKLTEATITPNADGYIALVINSANGINNVKTVVNNLLSTLQIEVGTSASDYVQHEEKTTIIPLSAPLRKIGDAYDYIDVKNGKIVRKIKTFDLGTLSYGRTGSRFYSSGITDGNAPSSTVKANILCPTYTATTRTDVEKNDFSISFVHTNDGDYINLYDTGVSDASQLKTKLNGVLLYYELATPTEEALTDEQKSALAEVDAIQSLDGAIIEALTNEQYRALANIVEPDAIITLK